MSPRVICLDCVSGDFKDEINLCYLCLEESVTDDLLGFYHRPGHSMLKLNFFLHSRFKVEYIKVGRSAVDRMKQQVRRLVPGYEFADSHGQEGATYAVKCSCCDEPITLPAWFCQICGAPIIV
jgi:hypothetical protein